MNQLEAMVARWLHRRCKHPPAAVVDLTEGDGKVRWCRHCGAVDRGFRYWELAVDPGAPGRVSHRGTEHRADRAAALKKRIRSMPGGPAEAKRRLEAFLED